MKSNVAIALTLFSALAGTALLPQAARAQNPPAPPPAAPQPPTETPEPVVTEAEPEEPEADPDAGRIFVGLDFSYFIPSSDKARRAFGDRFVSISPGLGAVKRISEKGVIALDFSIISNDIAEARVFMAPVGLSYIRRFSKDEKFIPYAGVSANINFADIRSARGDFEIKSGFRVGVGATVFAGLNLGRFSYIQARYYALTKMSGIDLSGLDLSTGVRFRF